MEDVKFTKIQGAGNDYLYIDARGHEESRDWPALSRAMSDRHFGVGSDGIILVLDSDKAAARMRMFNADGSEGEMCGNGVRGFAKYVMDRGIVSTDKSPLPIETLSGVVTVTPIFDGGKVSAARVVMGPPRLTPEEIPVILPEPQPAQAVTAPYGDPRGGATRTLEETEAIIDYPVDIGGYKLQLSFVSMGNPHAVTFLRSTVATFPLESVGPKVEHHPIFPNRVNFEIVNVVDQHHLDARVWERGSGITLACASGACAAVVAARLKGTVGDSVEVSLPGGMITVYWPGHGDVIMEGPTAEVFEGEWPE